MDRQGNQAYRLSIRGKMKESAKSMRARALQKEGLGIIETVLGRGERPIIGLYLYTAVSKMLEGIRRSAKYRKIRPHLIGTPAILLVRPRISQSELAGYLGCGRATAGKQVAACVRDGWVKRTRSLEDRRMYVLELTALGRSRLEEVAEVIDEHEALMFERMTSGDRATLRGLLSKFIVG